ncbi:MAG TPA: LysR family transcriptional regulator [Kiloniellaceae bacterium]|nr:LysR family transcriptional regulator [Kiloniellaceae bacterium]
MELYQIRYFIALCSTLNFTRAAEACNVSQPSLTRAIKKLEEELGGELFRRERSRTHLSELGRNMQPFLQQSYDSALAAKAQAEMYGRGETSVLRLGLSKTIDISLVLPVLRELARVMTGLDLHLVRRPAAAIMQLLEEGELELAVTAVGENSWERLNRWHLFAESFVLFAGKQHAFGDRDEVTLDELAGQNVVSRPYCEHAAALVSILDERHIATEVHCELNDETDLSAVVGEGLGIGIAPRSLAVPDDVMALPIKDAQLRRTVSLFAVAGRRHSPAATAFVRLMRSADWSQRAQ